ncbi:hypothetical protein pb186bvf_006083 [Paramecium bursaria]
MLSSQSLLDYDQISFDQHNLHDVLAVKLNNELLYLVSNSSITVYSLNFEIQQLQFRSNFQGCDRIEITNQKYIIIIRIEQGLYIVNLRFQKISRINLEYIQEQFYIIPKNYLIYYSLFQINKSNYLRYYSNILVKYKQICKLKLNEKIINLAICDQYIALQFTFHQQFNPSLQYMQTQDRLEIQIQFIKHWYIISQKRVCFNIFSKLNNINYFIKQQLVYSIVIRQYQKSDQLQKLFILSHGLEYCLLTLVETDCISRVETKYKYIDKLKIYNLYVKQINIQSKLPEDVFIG